MHHGRGRVGRRSLVVAVAVACLAVACSGDDETGSPATAPGSAPPGTTALAEEASAYAESWSAVHADAANTDHSPVAGPDDLAVRWERRIEGSMRIGPLPWTINLGPTVAPDGRLFVTSTQTGCHLQALDGETGETLWCAPDLDLFAVVSSPVLDRDGRLFVADGSGMHAFTFDGEALWTTPLVGVPLSSQLTADGRLVFVTHVGVVHVLDRDTGEDVLPPVELVPEPTWDPATGGMWACARGTEACPSANTLAVDGEGRLVFTFWEPGAPAAGLRAMRYRGGDAPSVEPLWTTDALPGGSGSSPVLSGDGRVYVTDNEGGLHALDLETGEGIWRVDIGFASAGSPSLSPEGLILPAGGNGSPLVAVRDEGAEGVVAWRRDDLANRGIATQTAGGRAYVTAHVGDHRNDLVVIDTADGREVDRAPVPGTSVFSVGTTVGPDGTVFVPTIVGGITAYEAAS